MARVFLAGALCAISVFAQPGQFDASPSLFTVMAALQSAGYYPEADSPNNHPLRAAVAKHLAGKNYASVAEIKAFLARRNQTPERLELNRFISFGLALDGPPNFSFKFQTHELPPDIVPLQGLESLMAKFYIEAGIEQLYAAAQPAIEKVLAEYQEVFVQNINQVNGYLRNPTSGYMGRRFQIFVELLGPPNQIQTRAYRDDYFLVLTPSPEPQLEYLRYAYLNYLLDPLSFKYINNLNKKKPLLDLAGAAPALEEHYKNDFQLLATASLIRAIEARMDKAGGARKADEALREGFILVPYFYEALAGYEKQEVSMRLFYPDLIDGIDLAKEDRRLVNVQFLSARPVRTVKVAPQEQKVELTGVFKTLEDAEDLYRARKVKEAKPLYLRALQETAERPLHAKAWYGLARIAALERDPELAVKLFEKAIDQEPDAQTKSWSHVYLGRLSDLAGERDKAVEQYKQALAVTGITPAAKAAAETGLKDSFQTEKKKEK